MFPSQRMISWTWDPILNAALCNPSFLTNSAWIRSKMSSLLNIREALKDGSINLVLLFLILNQPLIEAPHCFNPILGSDLLSSLILFGLSIALLHISPYTSSSCS